MRQQAAATAAVVAVAAALRVASLLEASRHALFDHLRLDAATYHRLAVQIAGGDLALGSEPYIVSPLYTYFLGGLYGLFGVGAWPLRVVQLALGLATTWLIIRLGRRLVGGPWPWIGGLFYAAYAPAVHYEALVAVATLFAFLFALLLDRATALLRRGDLRARAWAPVGALWGLAALARPNALLLLAPIGLVLLWASWPRWRRALVPALALAVAGAAVIAPVTARNVAVSGEAVLITKAGGINFYVGNGPGADGTYRVPPEVRGADSVELQHELFKAKAEAATGGAMAFREVDRYWMARTWEHIGADPMAWLGLLAFKAAIYANAQELPNCYSLGLMRELNPILGSLPFGYGLLFPLALPGLFLLLWRRDPAAAFVVLAALTLAASVILFHVISRYRFPVVPALIVAAAATLQALWRWGQERRWVPLLVAAALVGATSAATARPLFAEFVEDEWFKLGYAHHIRGQLDAAEQAYRRALAIQPEHLSSHKNLALLFEKRGDVGKAVVHWRILHQIATRDGHDGYAGKAAEHLARHGTGP